MPIHLLYSIVALVLASYNKAARAGMQEPKEGASGSERDRDVYFASWTCADKRTFPPFLRDTESCFVDGSNSHRHGGQVSPETLYNLKSRKPLILPAISLTRKWPSTEHAADPQARPASGQLLGAVKLGMSLLVLSI